MQLDRFAWTDQNERCGIIVRRPWGISFIEMPNHHPNPEHEFTIRAGDVKAYIARDSSEVLGFFHTHPGMHALRRPSTRDLYAAQRLPQFVHAMYHPYTRSLVWFDGTGVVGVEHLHARLRAGRVLS